MNAPIDRLPDFAPVQLPVPDAGVNPVQRFLDDLGLPWRDGLGELAQRFGVSPHPAFDWDVVSMEPGILGLDGELFPLATNVIAPISASVPDYFFTEISIGGDPLHNIERVAEALSKYLGHAPVGRTQMTLQCEWASGASAITLTSRPPEWQIYPTTNPAHDRDPRLRTSCSVGIYPGYRKPLSGHEQNAIDEASVLFDINGPNVARDVTALQRSRPSMSTVDFARDPSPQCERLLGTVSLSTDHRVLVICASELLVIPVSRISTIAVDKLRTARGPGGSWLRLGCSSSSGGVQVTIQVGHRDGPNDMDAIAHQLGRAIGKPVQINEPQEDS